MNEESVVKMKAAMKAMREVCDNPNDGECNNCPFMRYCSNWDGADVPPYVWKVKE